MATYVWDMWQSFEIAMLKLVLRTKKQPNMEFDTLVHEVCGAMHVDELAFKRYLATHMQAFVRAARA